MSRISDNAKKLEALKRAASFLKAQ
jgi:hypothetical protein